MKNKLIAYLGATAALATPAMAAAGDGFTEATAMVSSAQGLVTAILPVTLAIVGIGIALSIVKLVKRK